MYREFRQVAIQRPAAHDDRAAIVPIFFRTPSFLNNVEVNALSWRECPGCPHLSSFQFPIGLAVKRLRAASRPA